MAQLFLCARAASTRPGEKGGRGRLHRIVDGVGHRRDVGVQGPHPSLAVWPLRVMDPHTESI